MPVALSARERARDCVCLSLSEGTEEEAVP